LRKVLTKRQQAQARADGDEPNAKGEVVKQNSKLSNIIGKGRNQLSQAVRQQ